MRDDADLEVSELTVVWMRRPSFRDDLIHWKQPDVRDRAVIGSLGQEPAKKTLCEGGVMFEGTRFRACKVGFKKIRWMAGSNEFSQDYHSKQRQLTC